MSRRLSRGKGRSLSLGGKAVFFWAILTLCIFSGSVVGDNEVVGITTRMDSSLSLAFCDGCIVYEDAKVYLIGYGNVSISVNGEEYWSGDVNGSRSIGMVLPGGYVSVVVLFADDVFSYGMRVKNRSVEDTAVEEFGEVIKKVEMTELELLMELVKVHAVSIFFFVLACPLMFWIVKRQKEMEIREAV